MSESSCRICHRAPAAEVTFHGHEGMIVLMRFSRVHGPFCRECGLAAYRDITGRTLLRGWWGLGSFFVTAGVLVLNTVRRARIAALPEADRPANDRTLDPGKPLLDRPAAYGLLVPALLIIYVAFSTARS
ncbi:hypothetical protein ACWT_4802 [Actinoplanes sp. SE50]|uniref:hypothetical protein n=1 Tax=unclassified Actinoplanes TaxID=2626549 RepID=UPI00023EC2F5|nr:MULTISPECIES: hypothetical protein [unclassified Actinoplanes]AEV85821.1 hypothetical protein ACPL_4932 [Actinoplanes sp. SE50/110]ATO84217.1 hypothetical protein ACWT_4802 [Actinoplanes sp. SE50]SLM01627.1 hypothetical protein ACSP50_4863 [Actinoplanes sp. SE50/110]